MTTNDLYDLAEANDICVYDFRLEGRKALAVPGAIALDTQRMTARDEKLILAHEIGHCMTHTFYTAATPNVTLSRCETRAMKWAVKRLVDENRLRAALARGYELWELADLFEVDEITIEQAINLYFYNHI